MMKGRVVQKWCSGPGASSANGSRESNGSPRLRFPDDTVDGELANYALNRCQVASNGCWEWTKSVSKFGHGRMRFAGKLLLPHRLVAVAAGIVTQYEVVNRDTDYVLHHCDNPKCCNPEHLFAGSKSDNAKDCMAKGRHPWSR